jgi:hypothetical protein
VSAAACANACAAPGSVAATRRISSAAACVVAAASDSAFARCSGETRTASSTPGPARRAFGVPVPHRNRSLGRDKSVASLLAPK